MASRLWITHLLYANKSEPEMPSCRSSQSSSSAQGTRTTASASCSPMAANSGRTATRPSLIFACRETTLVFAAQMRGLIAQSWLTFDSGTSTISASDQRQLSWPGNSGAPSAERSKRRHHQRDPHPTADLQPQRIQRKGPPTSGLARKQTLGAPRQGATQSRLTSRSLGRG